MDQQEQLEKMEKPELIELAKIQRQTLETQSEVLQKITTKAAIAFSIWGILQIVLMILIFRRL